MATTSTGLNFQASCVYTSRLPSLSQGSSALRSVPTNRVRWVAFDNRIPSQRLEMALQVKVKTQPVSTLRSREDSRGCAYNDGRV